MNDKSFSAKFQLIVFIVIFTFITLLAVNQLLLNTYTKSAVQYSHSALQYTQDAYNVIKTATVSATPTASVSATPIKKIVLPVRVPSK